MSINLSSNYNFNYNIQKYTSEIKKINISDKSGETEDIKGLYDLAKTANNTDRERCYQKAVSIAENKLKEGKILTSEEALYAGHCAWNLAEARNLDPAFGISDLPGSPLKYYYKAAQFYQIANSTSDLQDAMDQLPVNSLPETYDFSQPNWIPTEK